MIVTKPQFPQPMAAGAAGMPRLRARAASTAPANLIASLGMITLLVYLFLVVSRVLDLITPLAVLHIPLILMVVLILVTPLSGLFLRALSMRGTQLVLAIMGWACVSTVFSVWRRGSIDFLKDLMLSIVIFVAIVALVRTVDDLRRVVAVQAAAMTVAALLSFVIRGDDTRLAMSAGTYGDPNGLAAALLQAMPLCFVFHDRLHGPIVKVIGALSLAPMLLAFARTGSRGGMIAFLLMVVLLFIRVSFLKKLLLGVVGLVLGVGLLVMLPESLRVRYMTLFGTPASSRTDLDLGGASSSSEARLALLKTSVALTLKNPVFGVGPGMFPVAADFQAKEDGYRRGTWQVTHNTYTQISSELGFPGLILFMSLVFISWRQARSVTRIPAHLRTPQLESLAQIGAVLEVSFFGFAISVVFLSLFYTMTWAIVLACMISMNRLVAQEGGLAQAAKSAAETPETASAGRRLPARFKPNRIAP